MVGYISDRLSSLPTLHKCFGSQTNPIMQKVTSHTVEYNRFDV